MSRIGVLSSLLVSVATQIRAAIHVAIAVEDSEEVRRTDACELTLGPSEAQVSCDDAPGRMTRNGLGSLEIGAGKTRVDE